MPIDLITLLSPKNLILFVVVFTRLSGFMSSAPMLSVYPIPVQVKVWFMATVSFVFFPLVLAKTGFHLPTNVPELIFILIKEFLIGYIVGFVANIVFIGVEIAADLLSMQMGLTAAQGLNPMTGDTSPIFTQAYTLMAAMIFIALNAWQWIFAAIFKTFQILPPGYSFSIGGTITHNVVVLTSEIFTIGLGIALPIFSVLLITDVLLGFVAKMMPQMNVFMVSMPVKIYIGLLLFIMLIQPTCSQIQLLIEKYCSSVLSVLGG